MRPTRWPVLATIAAVAGIVVYVVTPRVYNTLPTLSIYAPIWMALLAAAEGYVAAFTRARLSGRPGTKPILPMTVARLAALAKASSVVGALLGGGYAGFLAWVVQRSSQAASHDTKTAAVAVAFSALLVAAALFLEHVCRVRED